MVIIDPTHAGFVRVVWLVVGTVLLSGCVLDDIRETDRPTALVLRYTLIDESGDGGGADVGQHCSQASIRDGRAEIESSAYRALGNARPFLIVLPELDGDWATLGTGGFVVKLPGDVNANIHQKPVLVTRIEWIGNATHGHAEVDGDPVNLPHSWTKRSIREDWRIEAALAVGPSNIKTYDAGGPCA